jgi:hypothetical protein
MRHRTQPVPDSTRAPRGARMPPSGGDEKIIKTRFSFKRGERFFCRWVFQRHYRRRASHHEGPGQLVRRPVPCWPASRAGLRKAGTTIAAENGATPYQLMAIFGWKTLEQAELYTKKVRQRFMAGGSMHLIGFDQIVNESDPPAAGGGEKWVTFWIKTELYQRGLKALALPSGIEPLSPP